MTLGITDGTNNVGMQAGSGQAIYFSGRKESYGENVGYSYSSAFTISKSVGVTTDAANSGLVADISFVDGFAPTFVIKY